MDEEALSATGLAARRTSRYPLIAGALLVALGALLNPIVVGFLYAPDGIISSTRIQLVIWSGDGVLLTLGMAFLMTRRYRFTAFIAPRLLGLLASSVGAMLVLNAALSWGAAYLPERFVSRYLSPVANLRYLDAHEADIPWIFAENIHYAKPGVQVWSVQADSFGYRNPSGYIEAHPDPDVVLLGDSFTWGAASDVTMADVLREELPSITVYSMGVGGESIPHWRFQYERLLSAYGSTPCTVVLNLYSGNDLSDTTTFFRFQDEYGTVHSADYMSRNVPGVPTSSGLLSFVGLSELVHIATALNELSSIQAVELEGAVPGTYYVSVHHEPPQSQLTERVAEALRVSVRSIQTATPTARVVLSYIPTSSALYGKRIKNCEECTTDRARQRALSERLRGISAGLNIAYVDVTPGLIAAAESGVIHSGKHFNVDGYRTYATLLARSIEGLTDCE